MTDQSSVYINTTTAKSKLVKYGFYHYWINHSFAYVHNKFPFITTSGIECSWCHLKRFSYGIAYEHKPQFVQHYCDAFSMRRMLRDSKMYEFIYRAMRLYFWDMQLEYKKLIKWDEKYYLP